MALIPSKDALLDAGERIFWTAAAAGLAAGIVTVADWDPILVAVVTPILTAAKTYVATKTGNPDDAAIRLRRE
jgi:hypothetical protein